VPWLGWPRLVVVPKESACSRKYTAKNLPKRTGTKSLYVTNVRVHSPRNVEFFQVVNPQDIDRTSSPVAIEDLGLLPQFVTARLAVEDRLTSVGNTPLSQVALLELGTTPPAESQSSIHAQKLVRCHQRGALPNRLAFGALGGTRTPNLLIRK